ncbi:MAG TPA: hypothetical protein VMH04_13335 [Candidatus Solibacter sp.]|nr:hypothetical protein [Candidatus Solibacter sp.]
MQEGPSMVLDPLSIDRQMPWESRLLILYLTVVVIVSLVKSASVLRALYFSKPLRQPNTDEEFVLAWDRCSNKVHSVKRWVIVTVFWTILVTAMLLRDEFVFLTEQKALWSGALLFPTVEVLTVFVFGILVCAALYTVCAVLEGALCKQKADKRALGSQRSST